MGTNPNFQHGATLPADALNAAFVNKMDDVVEGGPPFHLANGNFDNLQVNYSLAVTQSLTCQWFQATGSATVPELSCNGPCAANTLVLNMLTYATIPSSVAIGTVLAISDSPSSTPGAIVSAGGGGYKVLLWYDGAVWKVIC